MSKSSGGPDDPNRILLEQILKALQEGKENNYRSQSSYEDLRYRAEVTQRVDLSKVINKTTFDKLIRAVEQQNRHMEVATTSNFNQGDWKGFKDTMKNSMKDFEKLGITADQMMKAILTYRNVILSEANVTEKKGYKSTTYSNVADNKNRELKELLAEMRRSNAASGAIDSAMHKVMDFVTGPELKKTLKQVGADLIEGLEKSKWVGGALRDTFRLIGLLGANWMSQFGQLGRILGGAFYVAMETAGPLLVRLLLQGMGKLLSNLPGIIGKFGWGRALGVTAAVAGSVWAFNEAKDSWQQGREGNAAAFGVGGTAMAAGGVALGAAGVASLGATAAGAAGATGIAGTLAGIAGALGPIGWTLLAIGAAVAGIAYLWKKYGDDIKQHYKDNKEFYDAWFNTIIDVLFPLKGMFDIFQWFRDVCPWKSGVDDGVGGTGTRAGIDAIDKLTAENVGRLKVAKDGSVLNATDFTQSELAAEMQAYQKARPKEFGNIYEVVGSKYANLASFQNDAVMTDQFTGQKGAVMYAGASEDMQRIRQLAVERGMDPKTAERILYSSGWSTSTSGHSLGALGHGNRYGLAYDIGLAGFNAQEQQWILEAAQARAAEKGLRGQWVRAEANVGGKTVLSESSIVEGTNQHLHAQMRAGYLRPTGADENEQNRAEARVLETTNKMMGVSDLIKMLPKEDRKRFAEELGKETPKDNADLLKIEEKILKGMGVYLDQNTNTYLKSDKTGNYALWDDDGTGNYKWKALTSSMHGYAQGATNGRY